MSTISSKSRGKRSINKSSVPPLPGQTSSAPPVPVQTSSVRTSVIQTSSVAPLPVHTPSVPTPVSDPSHVERRSSVRRHIRGPHIHTDDVVIPTGATRASDGVGGTAYFLAKGNDRKRGRGACNSAKVSGIVRTSRKKIRVELDVHHGRPIGQNVSSLFSHQIGAIIRTSLPTDHFDPRVSEYVGKLFSKIFREFKYELHTYFKDFDTKEEAKQNPPLEWYNRSIEQWGTLCDHFSDPAFVNQCNANKENRSKKKYEHHGGSKPFSLRYEKPVEEGSQFPEIDTFSEAYTNKAGEWTSDVAKTHYGEMIVKKNALLEQLATQYPDGTPAESITVPTEAGREIMMETLGVRPGREVRGLGFGRYRDLGTSSTQRSTSSSRLRELEQQLAAEKEARLEDRRSHKAEMQSIMNFMRGIAVKIPGVRIPPGFNAACEDDGTTSLD
ncbi:hypothetical protein HS088_TW21G01027 [Tripterygium wilfordii]|uniref:Mto1-like Mto2p-binding domain-containing protein n=1 Tax=Tripterygium wilfordii TaxID=458696 RepID=A0A7J7C424_TRIWF|nr:uncharacterized protein LOC119987626 [Tripterygium wilfordii]XP_038688462.1 uncharacterized protein LOC119987626 [Tripterygium wilfordii]XP_038688463.1 uncharacterized protein LOC119987626 [Tripterygium wilfordii]XP_038688464.1 uncharacterized protein LOC119987626 [Tripterygium wilfordii]XP_038688465.1 uncharacterized protein LOC119987626 [Tripterygium wilfordii]KAF5728873.1 hypothetical protein HS088_TW21G01027 [Tripterygium wilfordii]